MSPLPPLTPPIDRYGNPHFQEMRAQPKRFEGMVADLLACEAGVGGVGLFGVNGDPQDGVDILANDDSGSLIAVSCKCVSSTTPAAIVGYGDDFLNAWEAVWRDRRARRFILAIAAPNIAQRQRVDQISRERARFAPYSISYEVWGPEELSRRLGPHRALTSRWLDEVWATRLCGPPPQGQALTAAHTAQLFRAETAASRQAITRAEAALEQVRAGAPQHALDVVAELKGSATWPTLQPEAQAEVLRLEARISLFHKDLDAAQTLSDAADALSPAEPRLKAAIASRRSGPVAALEALGTPQTRPGRQLQASLHLDAGAIADARALIDHLHQEDPDDPETLRLVGWLRLIDNDRDGARQIADKAETLRPEWLNLHRLGAVVRYAQSLSPKLEAKATLSYGPIDAVWVRTDAAAAAHREDAYARFERLGAAPGAIGDEPAWMLAALSYAPDRQDAMRSLVETRLAADPMDEAALGWTVSLGLGLDISPNLSALREGYASGALTPFQTQMLAWLFSAMDPDAGAEFLHAHLGRQQDPDGVRPFIDQLRGRAAPDHPPGVAALRRLGQGPLNAEEWQVLDAQLKQCFADGPTEVGLHLASETARADRWSALAPYVEALLSLETGFGAELASIVHYHTAPPEQAASLIEQAFAFFRPGEAPLSMRRMRTIALSQFDPPAALKAANSLLAETDNAHDAHALIQLHLMAGHAQAAAPLAQRQLSLGTIDASQALRYSIGLKVEVPDLAADLWRKAMALGVSDGDVLHALEQGYRLGLDAETQPLFPRMQQQAQNGAPNIWLIGVDDVVEQVRARVQAGQAAYAQIQSGAAPIHLLARQLNSVGWIYRFDQDRPSAGTPPAIFLRHGARPLHIVSDRPWPEWRLHMDVTALIVADQLDLLDHVEASPHPVRISRFTSDVLRTIEEDIGAIQPSLVEIAQVIIAAHAAGRLTLSVPNDRPHAEWVAHERSGEGAHPTVSSVSLELARLGHPGLGPPPLEAEGQAGARPAPGARLLFTDNTLATLAMTGQLADALEFFQCAIEPDELARQVALADAAARAERITARYTRLRRRIADGIERGLYLPIQSSAASGEQDAEAAEFGAKTPLEASLLDIISARTVEGGVAWVDDRNISGYAHSGEHAVVGVVEVLAALVSAGVMNANDRRDRLRRLRAGGSLFIPMDADEVMTPLLSAPIDDGWMLETPDLAVLRRNFALALLQDANLKLGPTGNPLLDHRPDETGFIQANRGLLAECLIQVWNDEHAPLAARRARSEWLWSNLRMERCVRRLPSDGSKGGNALLVALQLSGLLVSAQAIRMPTTAQSVERREEFLDWLNDTALIPRLEDERFIAIVAQQVREALLFEPEGLTPDLVPIHKRLIGLHASQLPAVIRQTLLTDPTFVQAVALDVAERATVGDRSFVAAIFWRRIRRALRRGRAVVRTDENERVLILSFGGIVLLLGAIKARLDSPALPILAVDDHWEDRLATALEALDVQTAEADAVTASRAQPLEASRFMNAWAEAERGSVPRFYASMAEMLQPGRSPTGEDFWPPPANRLLHHLRLSPGDDRPFKDRVVDAHRRLTSQFDAGEAWRRLSGLPVDLSELPPPFAKEEALKRCSPLTRAHFAHAAAVAGDLEKCGEQLQSLIGGAAAETSLFLAVLGWTEAAYKQSAEWRALPVVDRLAVVWSHANRTTEILTASAINYPFVIEFFNAPAPGPDVGPNLVVDHRYDRDRANPAYLSPGSLLFQCVAHGVAGGALAALAGCEAEAALLNAITQGEDGARVLGLSVIATPQAIGDALQSFFDHDNLSLLGLEDDFSLLGPQIVAGSLEVLSRDPASKAWLTLASLTRQTAESETAAAIVEVFGALDFLKLFDQVEGHGCCKVALLVYRRTADAPSDEVALSKVRDLCLALQRRYPHAGSEDAGFIEALNGVLELVATFSQAETLEESLDRFHHGAEVITMAWPASVPHIRHTFEHIIRSTPADRLGSLWRTSVLLRSLA